MGYLYYCKNCGAFLSDKYEDDPVSCEKCYHQMSPLYITESNWDSLSEEEKDEFLKEYKKTDKIHEKNCPTHVAEGKENNPIQKDFDKFAITESFVGESKTTEFKNRDTPKKAGKVSGISIAAFICSFFGCIGLAGIVLGIIDLTKNDGRK